MSQDWALRNALHCRDTAGALEILRSRQADVNACDDSGRTPLHLAVEDESLLPVVQELLMLGASVNLPDAHGNTPLHRAAKHGHVQIALALRHHGADVQLKNSRGETAAESSRTVALRDELLKGVELEVDDAAESPGPGAEELGARGADGLRAEVLAQAQAQAVRRREKTAVAKVRAAPPPAPPCFLSGNAYAPSADASVSGAGGRPCAPHRMQTASNAPIRVCCRRRTGAARWSCARC